MKKAYNFQEEKGDFFKWQSVRLINQIKSFNYQNFRQTIKAHRLIIKKYKHKKQIALLNQKKAKVSNNKSINKKINNKSHKKIK